MTKTELNVQPLHELLKREVDFAEKYADFDIFDEKLHQIEYG